MAQYGIHIYSSMRLYIKGRAYFTYMAPPACRLLSVSMRVYCLFINVVAIWASQAFIHIHIHVNLHTYTYISVHAHTYVYTYKRTCVCVCVCVCVYMYIYAHTHKHTHTCTHTNTHTAHHALRKTDESNAYIYSSSSSFACCCKRFFISRLRSAIDSVFL